MFQRWPTVQDLSAATLEVINNSSYRQCSSKNVNNELGFIYFDVFVGGEPDVGGSRILFQRKKTS